MPEVLQKYYVAVEFPELNEFKLAVRKLVNSESLLGDPAHATIKFQLQVTQNAAATLASNLSLFVRSHELLPVEVRYEDLGVFPDVGVVYLALGGMFVDSWQALIEECARLGYPRAGFEGEQAHITLLSSIKQNRIPDLLTRIRALPDFPRGTFLARKLALYRKTSTIRHAKRTRWVEAYSVIF